LDGLAQRGRRLGLGNRLGGFVQSNRQVLDRFHFLAGLRRCSDFCRDLSLLGPFDLPKRKGRPSRCPKFIFPVEFMVCGHDLDLELNWADSANAGWDVPPIDALWVQRAFGGASPANSSL
jgi:hypothetical protein